MHYFACDDCDYLADEIEELDEHQEEADHYGLVCICQRSFRTYQALEQHRQNSQVHFGRICNGCNGDFFGEGELDRHLQGRRGVLLSQYCSCGKNFRTADDARKHAHYSSRHASFCGRCDKLFDNQDDAECHQRFYHGPGSERCDEDTHTVEHPVHQHLAVGIAVVQDPLPELVAASSGITANPNHEHSNRAPTCNVCLDHPEEKVVTECGHLFCRSCIVPALREGSRCPVCRVSTTTSTLRAVFF